MEVYLDNSATTCVCKEAADKIYEMMTVKYGNPSSLHSKGLEAEHEVENARKIIADNLGVKSEEIYFTSGGTEANNMALFGASEALKRNGNKIITTAIEHSSVIESASELQKQGYEVIFLQSESNGIISEEKLFNAIDKNTILVSMMAVNNETGAIQPFDKVKSIMKKNNCNGLYHCDAVQAFGKIPVRPTKYGIDIVTISSHKIHGAKGTGAIYLSKSTRIIPRMFGGEQQKKIRPGTEAAPLIAGFGKAVEILPDISNEYKFMQELQSYCIEKISEIDGIHINSPKNNLPYILNFSVEGIRSETMLHYLETLNIYVSSGSACAKGKKSHVLTALGLSQRLIDSAIRVSFSRYNTKSDIDALADGIKSGVSKLVRK